MPEFSDGFCEPIIWGAKLAFSVAEIAEGLELDEETVRAVIESRCGVRFPRRPTPEDFDIDKTRTGVRYLTWRHSREAAHDLLTGMAG